jgi:PIN domain nuclease of toxin-antitoxin system
MASVILDASALLALIQRERGAERVAEFLVKEACAVSVVNLSEVMAKLIITGVPAGDAEAIVRGIPAETIPCDELIAFRAGTLASQGKQFGLSLGDRICLATAQAHESAEGCTVLTTEQAWRNLHLEGVRIEVVREPRKAD